MMDERTFFKNLPGKTLETGLLHTSDDGAFRVLLMEEDSFDQTQYFMQMREALWARLGKMEKNVFYEMLPQWMAVKKLFNEKRFWGNHEKAYDYWFVAKEMTPIFGFKSHQNALLHHVSPKNIRLYPVLDSKGAHQKTLLMNVAALDEMARVRGKKRALLFVEQLKACLNQKGFLASPKKSQAVAVLAQALNKLSGEKEVLEDALDKMKIENRRLKKEVGILTQIKKLTECAC